MSNIWQPGKTLAQIEKEVIYLALKYFQNNKVHTAKSLGIAERTLYYKLAEYEGRDPEIEEDGQIPLPKDVTGDLVSKPPHKEKHHKHK